jgi:hypothetical protein
MTPNDEVHDIFIDVVMKQLLNVEVSIPNNASVAITVTQTC